MYQPMISDDNIGRLYRMKIKEKRPMTRLINQILDDFFSAYEGDDKEFGMGSTLQDSPGIYVEDRVL